MAVVSDSVIATNHNPALTGSHPIARRALSASERDSLRQLAAAVAGVKAIAANRQVDDAWGATLTIRGDAVYRDSDFSFDSPPPEVRSLVRYLRELSGLSIELYSFS